MEVEELSFGVLRLKAVGLSVEVWGLEIVEVWAPSSEVSVAVWALTDSAMSDQVLEPSVFERENWKQLQCHVTWNSWKQPKCHFKQTLKSSVEVGEMKAVSVMDEPPGMLWASSKRLCLCFFTLFEWMNCDRVSVWIVRGASHLSLEKKLSSD